MSVGEILRDRYKIIEIIGRGSQGKVLLALDKKMNEEK